MKIIFLLRVFVTALFIICMNINTSFSISLMDEFNVDEKKDSVPNYLYKKESTKMEWTTKELEDELPNYIKEIMARNKLIPWEQDVIYGFFVKKFFSLILVTYINEEEFFNSNVIMGRRKGLDFFTIYPDLWKNNLHIEKMAEFFFSPITGGLIQFRLKIGNENRWITIYDLEMQIDI